MEPRRTKRPSARAATGPSAARRGLKLAPETEPTQAVDLNAPHIQAMVSDMARRGEARLSDPNYEWIEWDDALAELAAPHIAAARKLRHMTQAQLGEKLGIPQSQVSRMEKDPESVTYRTLKRVASALGMRVTDLLSPKLITPQKK